MAALEKFSGLSPVAKATALTRLVHAETMRARDAGADELRASNILVHDLSGYIAAILDGRTSPEQDAAVLQALSAAPHLIAQLDALLAKKG